MPALTGEAPGNHGGGRELGFERRSSRYSTVEQGTWRLEFRFEGSSIAGLDGEFGSTASKWCGSDEERR